MRRTQPNGASHPTLLQIPGQSSQPLGQAALKPQERGWDSWLLAWGEPRKRRCGGTGS